MHRCDKCGLDYDPAYAEEYYESETGFMSVKCPNCGSLDAHLLAKCEGCEEYFMPFEMHNEGGKLFCPPCWIVLTDEEADTRCPKCREELKTVWHYTGGHGYRPYDVCPNHTMATAEGEQHTFRVQEAAAV